MGQGGQGIWGQARLSYNPQLPDFQSGNAWPGNAESHGGTSTRSLTTKNAEWSCMRKCRKRGPRKSPRPNSPRQPDQSQSVVIRPTGVLRAWPPLVRPPAWLFQTAMGTHQPSRQGTPKEKAPLTRGLELLADANLPKSANPWWHAVCGHRRQPEPAPFCSAHRGRSSRCSRGSWARRPPMQAVRASNCRSWFDHSCLKYPVR